MAAERTSLMASASVVIAPSRGRATLLLSQDASSIFQISEKLIEFVENVREFFFNISFVKRLMRLVVGFRH